MSVDARSRPNNHADPRGRRLESWKEIAAYLGRDVTTAQRWEKKERLPVYRLQHSKLGSIYAYTSELDSWRDKQALRGATDALAAEADHQPTRIWRARRWLLVGGVVLVGLLAGAYLTTRSRAVNATRPKIQSLAVLPLKNLSGDPTQEYLADGMTEELIGRLAAIHDLRVISRTSVMGFRDTKLSVPEIAKKLGVDAFVEGSVIREGNRIRVHAQLIRAATDEHFWSEEYDRELQDVLALQSEVAQAIAEKVKVSITGQERDRLVAARPVAPEVYESYVKGSNDPQYTKAQIEHRIADFQDAIRMDPTFAPAYVGGRNLYQLPGHVCWGSPI
jgi:TolB-like protein